MIVDLRKSNPIVHAHIHCGDNIIRNIMALFTYGSDHFTGIVPISTLIVVLAFLIFVVVIMVSGLSPGDIIGLAFIFIIVCVLAAATVYVYNKTTCSKKKQTPVQKSKHSDPDYEVGAVVYT